MEKPIKPKLPELVCVDDAIADPEGKAPVIPNKSPDTRRYAGYKLMTDKEGGCLYCAKPLSSVDETCPHCGWDGEYPITKVPTPPSNLEDADALMMPDKAIIKSVKPPCIRDFKVELPQPGRSFAKPSAVAEALTVLKALPKAFEENDATLEAGVLAEAIDRLEVAMNTPPPAPAPSTTNAHEERMLRHFTYDHLPERLQAASAPWCELAVLLCHSTKPGPERTVALRKLLEGKDAAVRAMLHPGC